MTRVLGLDIGGTRSRARLWADGRVVAEASGPSASPVAAGDGAEAALERILESLAIDGPLDAACAGAAGLSGPGARGLFDRKLRALTAGGPVVVVDDGYLVLPAAGHDDGIGLVAGTGSVAYGHHAGRVVRVGGWGYLLGDEGSGYGLVRAAARTVLARADAGLPPGELGGDLAAAAATTPSRLLDHLYADVSPRRWAALAPTVLDSRDPAVDGLVADAVAAVVALAGTALRRLAAPPLPVVVAGGLTAHPRYRSAVVAGLRASAGAPVAVLGEPPVAGAVRLALEALRLPPTSASAAARRLGGAEP